MLVKDKIINTVNSHNYSKGLNYDFDTIDLKKVIHLTDKSKIFKFEVESQRNYNVYKVDITTKNNDVILTYCSCPQFEKELTCKHVAACLIKEKSKIFNEQNKLIKNDFDLATTIFKNLISKNNQPKHQLNLNIELFFRKTYYSNNLYIKLKIGEEKLYSVGTKAKQFFDLYSEPENKGIFFGQKLTYNPMIHYFNEEDKKILDFLTNEYYHYYDTNYYSNDIYMSEQSQIKLFKLLKNKEYTITLHGKFIGYKEDFPFNTEITKENDIYAFKVMPIGNILFLSNQILIKDNEIYLLNEKFLSIIETFSREKIYELPFKKEQLGLFADSILPILKNDITIADNLKNEICITEPITKIYLDFKDDKIIGNVKFTYNETTIDYFENSNIIRNKEFEDNIISDLFNYKFTINNDTLEIEDLEDIGDFLDYDLKILSQKYDVFTSKKLDETNIIKKNKIISQFSIGQDNIMSYNFSLDNINVNELSHIFDNLKEKKKYYKLKNGNILNLEENNNLLELQNLMTDIDITTSDLKNGGTIPKYRAIYLDSLKEKNYNIIKTDNLFDEFIKKFKQYKNAEVYINTKDKKILRDYQLIGVKWLYNIYKCDLGGILADEMGLGKSLQTICFIKAVLKEKKDSKILIVSPTSLIYNWEKEFDKYGSELKYKVIAEGKNKRMQHLNNLTTNIIITTYGLLRQDKDLYNELNFEIMIIDEAQNIKNPMAGITKTVKQIKSRTKIALTGTPIENSVVELWSIFDFIMPGFLTNLKKFQSLYNIKDFSDDKINVLNNLNTQISPFILRRKKIDVAKELPNKIENNIYFDMYPEQKKIYLAQLKKTKQEMDEIIKTEGFLKAKFKILQLLTKLRQICLDPKIIFEDYKGGSVKIDELTNLVKRIIENNHKILLFTSFKTALEIVKERFNNEGITSYSIDGSISSKKRMELVEKFNNDNTNVFLIMLKAGGTGLNLTSADTVIHLDLWWNPQVENQATDRAHRIGQTKNVEVIKLICNGTIEERIIELQNKKKILSDTLIEGENRNQNLLEKLSEKDIKNLLTYDEN